MSMTDALPDPFCQGGPIRLKQGYSPESESVEEAAIDR